MLLLRHFHKKTLPKEIIMCNPDAIEYGKQFSLLKSNHTQPIAKTIFKQMKIEIHFFPMENFKWISSFVCMLHFFLPYKNRIFLFSINLLFEIELQYIFR